MLTKARDLIGRTIRATDGEIGSVTTLYFDDDRWTVRYFVVDTGYWLPGRRVLVSPFSIRQPDSTAGSLDVSLTRQQVKNSPDVETERPISRQHEVAYSDYYGYPYYWAGPGVWGAAAVPAWPMAPPPEDSRAAALQQDIRRPNDDRNSHLRDVKQVTGYHIHASDGSIGHVGDFLVDDQSWTIRYLIVETKNWTGGRRVLIAPHWARAISWEESKIDVALTRDQISRSPEYDPDRHVQRSYEDRLHAHYVVPPYWTAADEAGRPASRDASGALSGMARLEQFDDLEVAHGDVDVRGWKVVASDAVTVGSVEHLIVDRPAMKVRYLETGLHGLHAGDKTRDVLIPIEYADIDTSSREVRLKTLPSSRVAALPEFTGLPIDPELDAQTRRHFVGPIENAEREHAVQGGRRQTTARRS